MRRVCMPIFEYLCDDCGARFEKLVLRPASDQVLCPSCGKDHLTQQISAFLSPVPGKFKDKPQPHPEYPYGYLGKHDD
jgi:putative FmdB family regulatory protein